MDDRMVLDDFRNPDHEPTELETMEDVMRVFRSELAHLLGESQLMDAVCRVLEPTLADLISSVGHGIAEEIAAVYGVKASILEQTVDSSGYSRGMAVMWREAERIARTHIETAGSDV